MKEKIVDNLSEMLGGIDDDIFAEAYNVNDGAALAELKAKEKKEKGFLFFKDMSSHRQLKIAAVIVAAIILLGGVTVAATKIISSLMGGEGNSSGDDSTVINIQTEKPGNTSAPSEPVMSETPGISTEAPTETINPMAAPAQPITFDNMVEAIKFINNPDYSSFFDWHKDTYKSMTERIKGEEKIYDTEHKTVNLYNGEVTLYPKVKFEDVGVRRFYQKDSILYDVIVYYVDPAYTVDAGQSDCLETYYRERFSMEPDFDKYETANDAIPYLYSLNGSNGKTTVRAFLDNNHYISVKAEDSVENIIDFVNGLSVVERSLDVNAAETATPAPTATPTAVPTATPVPTAKPTVAPTATPTENPIRSEYSFYRYTLSYEDNVFYVNFPEGNDDPSWTGTGMVGPTSVTYDSLDKVRNVILTGTLSESDISKIRSFYFRNEKGVILPDLYNLYVPVYPDGSSPIGVASVTKYGYQVGGMIVMHEAGYKAAVAEQSDYIKQEDVTVTKTEKLSDKNGTACYYTSSGDISYKWVRYTLTKGSKTAVVDEIRVVQGGDYALNELNIYYEENGLYYALKSRDPSKWLTEEEIMGYGLKPYDVQVSKDILNQKDQEVMVVEKLTAMQKNHQTPEVISVGEEYEGSKITPLEVYVMDSEANNAPVKKKGMKVWICDREKNKIDYVYTNSNGVAFFEAPAGTYYFYFEGDEEYKDVYSTSITCWNTFTYAYTYDEMVPVNRICFTSRG